MATDVKNEIWVLATRVAKHIGDGFLDIQFRVGSKCLKDRPNGLRIYLHDAAQPLTCGTPDVRVMVLGPPSRSIKDRGWMALTDLDQCRGSHLARLLLVARCQSLEFGEDGSGFDTASDKQLLDVVNLSNHSTVYLV